MGAFEEPLCVSARTPANLWQAYRIYPDRLELQSWLLLRTFVIPGNQILAIVVRPPVLGGRRDLIWDLKLDNADLFRHVLVSRKNGWLKRLAFTLDNPDEFARVGQTILV